MLGWSVIGLAYDIAGVIVLGAALAATPHDAILRQAGTYWNGNVGVYHALYMQRFDARIGLGLLVAGFVLQALGAVGLAQNDPLAWLLWGALVFGVAIFFPLRRRVLARLPSQFDSPDE